ncbi:MAG: UDP-2,3-diacylglucosamine diphosphatase LpxI [Syntrophobacterales bacterium]|nr:UDP-2,3-diacylglucosamine diphosphatase LpxI [Syntrophobacterales bacterium]
MIRKELSLTNSSNNPIGLIAGGGQFPILFSKAAKENGFSVVAIGIEGDASNELAKWTDYLYWVKLGEVGKIISILKNQCVGRVVLAGHVDKKRIYSRIKLDLRGAKLAMKLINKNDDALLRTFAEELEKEGIIVEPSTLFLTSLIAPEGILTKRVPTPREVKDIVFGWRLAKSIGGMDIGQCVVVKHQAVLAVEAIDGTDATIIRGGKLCNGGAVVVKVSKPGQDLRFDVPSVGLGTIETMKKVDAKVLAIEAGKTLIFDKDAMIKEADSGGIAIVALKNPEDIKHLQRKVDGYKGIFSFLRGRKKSLKMGVVGTGYLGKFHVEKLAQMPFVDLRAVVDINEEVAKSVGNRFRVPYFTSHHEIIGEVEAVTIATPTDTHFSIAQDLLEAGIHVFIEKPITRRLEEADHLIELAERKGCVLQVGHIERFNPAFIALSKRIKSPSFIYSKRLSPFKERSVGIDVVLDLMIHDIDLLLNLVPGEISSWSIDGKAVVTHLPDVVFARMDFSTGTTAYLEASRIWSDEIRKMEVIENGVCLVADYKRQEVHEFSINSKANVPKVLEVEPMDTLESELRSFVEAVMFSNKPSVDGQAARRALALALQMSQAISKTF